MTNLTRASGTRQISEGAHGLAGWHEQHPNWAGRERQWRPIRSGELGRLACCPASPGTSKPQPVSIDTDGTRANKIEDGRRLTIHIAICREVSPDSLDDDGGSAHLLPVRHFSTAVGGHQVSGPPRVPAQF